MLAALTWSRSINKHHVNFHAKITGLTHHDINAGGIGGKAKWNLETRGCRDPIEAKGTKVHCFLSIPGSPGSPGSPMVHGALYNAPCMVQGSHESNSAKMPYPYCKTETHLYHYKESYHSGNRVITTSNFEGVWNFGRIFEGFEKYSQNFKGSKIFQIWL